LQGNTVIQCTSDFLSRINYIGVDDERGNVETIGVRRDVIKW